MKRQRAFALQMCMCFRSVAFVDVTHHGSPNKRQNNKGTPATHPSIHPSSPLTMSSSAASNNNTIDPEDPNYVPPKEETIDEILQKDAEDER